MYKIILYLLLVFISAGSLAQDKKLVQFSGLVKSEDGRGIPFVHVVSMSTRSGAISNNAGLYSLITVAADTIQFSCVGFKKRKVVIPANLEAFRYNLDIVMEQDTIAIEAVTIAPLPPYEEFRRAVLGMDTRDRDLDNFEKNMALMFRQLELEPIATPGTGYYMTLQEITDRNYTRGQYPQNNLLNPLRWKKFIESIRDGSLFKKK
jgi:hypothetical protein